MYFLLPIIAILALIFIVVTSKGGEISLIPITKEPIPEYRKKSSVMNGSESAFFFELQKQLPEGYYIFPKMRIADILDPIHGKGFYHRRNQVLPKHIDFLICDKYFKPIVAIELNGKSHLRQDRIERDLLVTQMFKDANLRLEFVDVGTNFSSVLKSIVLNL